MQLPTKIGAMNDHAPEQAALHPNRWQPLVQKIWPFAAGIALTLLGVWYYTPLAPAPVSPSPEEIQVEILETIAAATPLPAYSAQVYQTIVPSLVFIQTKRDQASLTEGQGGFGVGSGVVINADGQVLTSLHVVVDATEIELQFADGTRATAEIAGSDPTIDMALLTPSRPPELLVPAVIGDSSAMRVGDETFALGNPLGLPGSLSAGVISGFDRAITPEGSDFQLEGLIQFDAAVNPGNSGGPLLNRSGHVIGIVTALANPTEQDFFIGIGFAVPILTAVSGAGGGGPNY